MADRHEIQRELEQKINAGESTVHQLKAKLAEAGDDVSEETQKALAAAESMLEKGKARFDELAGATDEEFDELWEDTKENWNALSAGLERGWDSLSDRVKGFFS